MLSLLRAHQTHSRLAQENWRRTPLLCSLAKSFEQRLPAWPYLLKRRLLGICPSPVEWQGRELLPDDQYPTSLSIPHVSALERLSPLQSSQRSESRSSSRRGTPQARPRSENRRRECRTLR